MYEDKEFEIELQNNFWNSLDDKEKHEFKQDYKLLKEKFNRAYHYDTKRQILYKMVSLEDVYGQHNLEKED